jgi:D-alanyl-D-alanine carboxypeptidase
VANFYESTIKKDKRFTSKDAIADVALLEPATREAVADLIAEAKKKGVELMVVETYRSTVRQDDLFKQGKTKVKTVGAQHYGLGCEIARVKGGKPSTDGDFKILGDLAKANGLIWGGDWGEPGKKPAVAAEHYMQRIKVADQPKLFEGRWYPDDNYDPWKK